MKKILHKFIAVSVAVILTFPSCTSELDELWNNPMTYTPAPEEVISGLFTRLQATRFWTRDYGEWWHQFNTLATSFSCFAQINVRPASMAINRIERWAMNNFGVVNDNFAQQTGPARFNQFFTEMRNYGLIRDELQGLSGADYADNVIYYRLATVLKNIVALQKIDMFGQIPFFDAFRGTQGVFFPQYDDPLEVYKAVIDQYRAIADELPQLHNAMSSAGRTILSRQDIFFNGDIEQWVQFINAHILRSSVRISGVAEEFARGHIATAIQNLQEGDTYFRHPWRNEVTWGYNAGGLFTRAFEEQFDALGVPDIIMTRMSHGAGGIWDIEVDDPRLPVITAGHSLDGTADNVRFFGTSMDWERNRVLHLTGGPGGAIKRNVFPQPPLPAQFWTSTRSVTPGQFVQGIPWTVYNPITFYMQSEVVTRLFTRAEIDLLLAEVALKGFAPTGKTAGQHIHDAVVNSTAFWYMMNQQPVNVTAAQWCALSRAILTPPKPSATIINNYASFIQAQFEAASDKMEIIMQQKYIHLNIMDPFELFAELRRTRRPLLEPITSTGGGNVLVNQTMMVERFRLPDSERVHNAEAFEAVRRYDEFNVPIFWVPENLRGVMPFLPRAIKDPL